MSHAHEISSMNFDETLKNNNIVVLDFWASWCGPCKTFGPIFEKVASRQPDVFFGKINTENEQLLASVLNIRSIPTIMIFRENILVFAQAGALPEKALEDVLTQVKNLDMNEVRSQIAKEEAEESTKINS